MLSLLNNLAAHAPQCHRCLFDAGVLDAIVAVLRTSFAYSLFVHSFHACKDRVVLLPSCSLYGAATLRAPPLGPGRGLTLPCGWNNAGENAPAELAQSHGHHVHTVPAQAHDPDHTGLERAEVVGRAVSCLHNFSNHPASRPAVRSSGAAGPSSTTTILG